MDFLKNNQKFWDEQVEKGNKWTIAVTHDVIEKAKNGEWAITITATKAVPREWFPHNLKGKKILCLASGGGQQGPILSAAGAIVTVFDYSINQLKQDEYVARKEGLSLDVVQGDMRDLSCFQDETFDFIVHPVSNCYVDDVKSVYKEAYRVLKKGGIFLAGLVNPIRYLFDIRDYDLGKLTVKYKIPYSDLELDEKDFKELILEQNRPVEFGHSLQELIQSQLDAGFLIAGYYDDECGRDDLLDAYIASFFATKAIKL